MSTYMSAFGELRVGAGEACEPARFAMKLKSMVAGICRNISLWYPEKFYYKREFNGFGYIGRKYMARDEFF